MEGRRGVISLIFLMVTSQIFLNCPSRAFFNLEEIYKFQFLTDANGKTWIIASNSETIPEKLATISQQLHERSSPTVIMLNNFPHDRNLSYFGREFEDNQIFQPCELEVKYSRWELIVLVSSESSDFDSNLKLTEALLLSRMARPHLDIFVQILSKHGMQEFRKSEYARRFRQHNYLIVDQNFHTTNLIRNCYDNVQKPCKHLLEGKTMSAAIT